MRQCVRSTHANATLVFAFLHNLHNSNKNVCVCTEKRFLILWAANFHRALFFCVVINFKTGANADIKKWDFHTAIEKKIGKVTPEKKSITELTATSWSTNACIIKTKWLVKKKKHIFLNDFFKWMKRCGLLYECIGTHEIPEKKLT